MRTIGPIRRALTALSLVMAVGTCGYMWIEGWDLWKSLYFTVITLTTVGYGDYGLSEASYWFTTVLLVGGLGVVTYSAGQIVPIVFNQRIVRERTMRKRIQGLRDHFIVCGLGRVGRAVCASLRTEGVPFVAIEPEQASVDWACEQGYLAMVGDATEDEILEAAGIIHARGLACVTGADPTNIVIALSARQLCPDLFIIGRADQEGTARKMERAGASRVISPILAGGGKIAHTLVKPHLVDLFEPTRADEEDDESGIELAEVTVRPDSGLDGLTIRQCEATHGAIAFVAITHPSTGTLFRPSADEPLRPGDVLITAGDVMAIGRLQDQARGMRAAA